MMDSKKVQTIMDWKIPKTVRDVQCFLELVNYYRIFIKDFSQVAALLIHLICKDKLQWNQEAEAIFKALKTTFVCASIVYHIDFFKHFL